MIKGQQKNCQYVLVVNFKTNNDSDKVGGMGCTVVRAVVSVIGSLVARFFSRYSSFPLSAKTNIPKFQFDPESEGHRFVSRETV